MLDAEIRKEKRKKTLKVFWKFRKDSYLCSPNGNGGENKNDKEGPGAHRNTADTEVEATKFFKKTQSCSVTSRQTKVMNKFKNCSIRSKIRDIKKEF